MSFGRRDAEGWQSVQRDIEEIQILADKESNLSVKNAYLQILQSKLLNESLVPVQQELWNRLFEAFKLGGVELIGINFKLSGMEVDDLLDLLHLANDLDFRVGGDEYMDFADGLFRFLETMKGDRLDSLLAEYFGQYPSRAETMLINLVQCEDLIRGRLLDLVSMKRDSLTQSVLCEGVIKLLEMEGENSSEENPVVYIDEDDAKIYLKKLMEDETILDDGLVELIEKVKGGKLMKKLMDKIIHLLENPKNRALYINGFDSVGAAIIRKLSMEALAEVVSCRIEGFDDERLLALARMKTLSKISDSILIGLLVEKDLNPGKNDLDGERRLLVRQTILANKNFRDRLMKLNLIGIFQQTTSNY